MLIVRIPKRSKAVEEATIGQWLKAEGEEVQAGDLICRLEAADAVYEVESAVAGKLLKVLVSEGAVAAVGEAVALIGDEGEDAARALADLEAERAAAKPGKAFKPASAPPRVDTSAPAGAPGVAPAPTAPAAPPAAGEPPAGIVPVLMPQPGESVEEGTIVQWRVKEGDQINVGDIIFDVETDKATIEVEAVDAGRLSRIVVHADKTVDVLVPVGYLSDDDAAVDTFLAGGGAAAPAAPPTIASKAGDSASAESPKAPAGRPPAVKTETGRVKASPAAHKLAADRGIDLSAIGTGSGPRGRVLSTDVEAAIAGGTAAGVSPAAGLRGEPVRKRMSGMRKAIAKNLQHSKQTIPHFYIKQKIRAEALMAAYKKLKEAAEFKCTINDFVVAAVAKIVAERPEFRCQLDGTDLLEYPNANIGIAVGVENGLVVPVVVSADKLSFRELAGQTRRLVESAREGKPENMGEGVFTITNMGMFKIDEFLAIINPPEAAILAVGVAREDVIVEDGKVSAGMTMTVMLSVDHRAVDGVMAAEFVNRLKELLEAPEELLQRQEDNG